MGLAWDGVSANSSLGGFCVYWSKWCGEQWRREEDAAEQVPILNAALSGPTRTPRSHGKGPSKGLPTDFYHSLVSQDGD